MKMGVLNLFLLPIVYVSYANGIKTFEDRPRIEVLHGNLKIVAAPGKNINFEATGQSSIAINDIDVVTTLTKAQSATKLTESYQHTLSSYSDRLEALESRNLDPIVFGNITNSTDQAVSKIVFRRLSRRVDLLQKRVNNLQTLLYHDDCASNPCKNGGECQDLFGNFLCSCNIGWEGSDCSVDINECSKFQGTDLGCQNGGVCINTIGSYRCDCINGYIGLHCLRKSVDCATAGPELCGHGICVSQNNADGYKCLCDQGWTTDGKNAACNVDVNECQQNHTPCAPNVECINVPGSFYCGHCPIGFTGNGYQCSDIDECLNNNGGCSTSPSVVCMNTHGSSVCGPCPPGYVGNGKICYYQGICNINNGNCHHLATCRDSPNLGAIQCVCPSGYIGNGVGPNGCIRTNAPLTTCSPNPCIHGYCSVNPTDGNYKCDCYRFYTGKNCDTLKSIACTPNPCKNEGECQNVNNRLKCTCKSGFVGKFCQTQLQGCGGYLKSDQGTLKFPSEDFESYNHRSNCAWSISLNSTSKVIKVNISKFDIEDSPYCDHDWLEIHDGRSTAAHSLGRFCGNKIPLNGTFTSTHDTLYFWFRSDRENNAGGFQLTWKAVIPKCNQAIFSRTHGSIESPGSPGNYPLNRDCSWKLMAPLDRRYMFHFYKLNIGENKDCGADYLKFYSTLFPESDDTVFAKFCNSSTPSPFYSPGNKVSINFHSDDKDTYPGFQMTYSIVEGIPGCGGVFTASTGIISSSHSNNGDLNICQYKIQMSIYRKIKITFTTFNLDTDGGCSKNYVEILEGSDENFQSIGKYCGKTLPPPYISESNQLTIVSASSGAQDNEGWKLEYENVCGKIYTNASGSFDINPVPTETIDCIYQVQRPPGEIIIAFFKMTLLYPFRLRMARSEWGNCFFNYVEVRDGDHENSTLIGKYCGSTRVNVTTTHNYLWMKVRLKTRQSSLINTIRVEYTSMNVGCGGILRKSLGTIASPTHPEGYYRSSLNCKWTIIAPPTNVIKLTWMLFDLESSLDCEYDYVQVFDNNTDLGEGQLMGKYCGNKSPPVLVSSSNIMSVFFSTDVTIGMDGFLASFIFIPEKNVCGGEYFTSAGVIKSPRYPEPYPTNKECSWTITVQPGQQILLNVTDFYIEHYSGCRYDWLEIRNGGTSASPLIGKYCGVTIPKQITSHANKIYIFFKSDLSKTEPGFRITWSSTTTGCGGILTSPTGSIISPQYPEAYNKNTECLWKIITSAGSRIQAVFSDINLEKQLHCLADYVQLFDGIKKNSASLGKFCYEAPEPVKSSSNAMLVKFRSDVAFEGRGFKMHYTTVCQNIVKGFRGVIESPNFPNEYAQDQDCLWEIQVSDRNKINITFSHFELERSVTNPSKNNTCLFDYVEISFGDPPLDFEGRRSFTTFGRFCGSENPGHISLDSDHAKIKFVSDKLLLGSGFRLEWELFGCGGFLRRNSGTITSPNYPASYPPSVVCEWRIEVDFGQSVEIEFMEVDVEKDTSCDFDSVSVYNGIDDTYNLLATICRQKNTTKISSTGNFMFVKFKSDYSYHGKGFLAKYKTIPTNCGGKFTATEGYIYSPNYPKNYNQNETCEYFIQVDEGHTVEISFEDLDLLETHDCLNNYVKIHDGPSAAYPVLIQACGNKAPNNTIKSSYNEVFIEFRSPRFLTSKGFKLKYVKSCGSKITTQSSGIVKVHEDEFSDSIQSCTWTIVSSDPSKHIHLTISQLSSQTYCVFDSFPLQIYNGESTEAPLIHEYCGPKVPPTITTDGSAVTIQINSQMTFFATYSVYDSQCGGSLNSAEGYFSSPGYPKKYTTDIECEWTIKISKGNHVTLNFIEFSLLNSENCNTDFLEIRTLNSSGPLLGVFCGKNAPENITHIGSIWLLYKSSKILPGDSTITAKGFYAQYALNEDNELTGSSGEIESPLYPFSIMDYRTFTWKITVSTKKKVRLSFKEFYLDAKDSVIGDECYFATFKVFDGVDDTATSLGEYCGLVTPNAVTSSSNIMYIQVDYSSPRLGSRFIVKWEETEGSSPIAENKYNTECNNTDEVININKLNRYIFTSPGYPGGYANNIKCMWRFSTKPGNHLIIQMMDVDLGVNLNRRFGVYFDCDKFNDVITIYQRKLTDNDWEKVKSICKKQDYTNNIHVTNDLKIEFTTNRYLNGTGFKAKITEGCGGYLTDPTGYIEYGNNTKKGYECQWNVTVGSTKMIELVFEEMNIEHDSNKGCDNFLLIRNGKFSDSPLLGTGKYCGNTLPDKLFTTANNLFVKYKGSTGITGFRLKYQEVSADCGGNIILSSYDNFTEISSPNYPNIPKPHIECQWKITAPIGEILRIDFEERFDLTSKSSCNVEYVEIRNGATEYSSLIGKYCKEAPSSQFSTDNMMFVKFFTDTDEPKNGFKAKISVSSCGGTVRGLQGSLSYGSTKDKNHECKWYIEGPIDHYLTISFIHLDISCASNYISFNEVSFIGGFGNFNGSSLGKFCGKTLPQPITSSSNKVTVKFKKDSGNGQFSLKYHFSQSECGGIVETESGIIESPGYPHMNHNNRNCQWKIVVPMGRRITLNLLDMDLGATGNYGRGFAIMDGASFKIRLALLTSFNNVRTYESSSNKLMIFFWSSDKSEHRGFKANFSSNLPTICEGDFDSENGVITTPKARNNMYDCEWIHKRTDIEEKKTFTLSITATTNYTKTNSDFYGLYTPVLIQVSSKNEKQILGKLYSTTITPLIIRSPFLITNLLALSGLNYYMNFTATYKTYNCGGMERAQVGVITSPKFPNKPFKSYECTWLITVDVGQTINVTTVSLNLGDDCQKSYLVIYNGNLPTFPKIGKFCKNSKPEMLISQSNHLWIDYKYDQSSSGTGFKMKYEALSSGCGGIFHDKTRNIHSPNYGIKDYPHNAECLWVIESAPGYHIKLNFIDRFHLEESTNCSNDFVETWSWQEDKWVSLGRKCGRNIPTSVKSIGTKMKILFRSNDRIAGSGFKAKWEWLCGGKFTARSKVREIVSPGYPISYENNLHCEYIIETESESVNIKFIDFELESGNPDCKYDNVTIFSKTYSSMYGISKTSYCGDKMPPYIRMKGSVIIKFQTDSRNKKKGFKFEYKDDSCDEVITKEGIIKRDLVSELEFGAYQRFFQPKIRCIWNITAPKNYMVIVLVKKLELFYNSGCYGQNLEIFDTLNRSANHRLAELCGNINDEFPIKSETGEMSVKLETRPYGFRGFLAEIQFSPGPAVGCGGTIGLNETKVIKSPNLADINCAWKIHGPNDHQIEIKIDKLKSSNSCKKSNTTKVACGCIMLEIRDGASPFADKMEKLCIGIDEANPKPSFRTSAQYAYIQILIIGQINDAFRATLTPVLSICGESTFKATTTPKELTSANYANGSYPAYIKCSYAIFSPSYFNKLMLHFIDYDLTDEISNTDEGRKCTGDYIQIYEDTNTLPTNELGPQASYNGGSKQISLTYSDPKGRYLLCGKDDVPFDIFASGKSVTVSLVSKGKMPKGKGFKLQYSLGGCFWNYTAQQGRINNGNNKGPCEFSIKVPENRTINVYFIGFHILYSVNCSVNALQVRDGSSTGPILATVCGFRLPDPIFSKTNQLYFTLFNKTTLSLVKFDFIYVTTEYGPGCGGEIFNNKGRIYSPLYPNAFRNDTTCTWTIRPPVGLHLAMKFKNFDIQGTCEQTNVKVIADNLNVELCQDYKPGPIVRSRSEIKIVYTSSVHNGGTGWVLAFLAVTSDTTDIGY